MILAVAATEIEMQPLMSLRPPGSNLVYCLTGVGPLESAVRLTRFLADQGRQVRSVINFGIAGAYHSESGVHLLDLCLAEREVFGDFGICLGETVASFNNPKFGRPPLFTLATPLLQHVRSHLADRRISSHCGTFVTVAGASGTTARGRWLQERYQALCENMEGAAVARVCREFDVPLVELRCISNMVEDRPGTPWKIEEACCEAAAAAALAIDAMEGV